MMESMRYSVMADNIKVCVVNPGPVATNFIARFKREGPTRRLEPSDLTLAHRMTAASVTHLESRIEGGQSASSCGEAIADTIVREAAKTVSLDTHGGVIFWNGTSDAASQIVDNVKCNPDGGWVFYLCGY
jgi:NAD(P)-dependent dehydrogenase (short-subunit alcohol dehydrogenase family)